MSRGRRLLSFSNNIRYLRSCRSLGTGLALTRRSSECPARTVIRGSHGHFHPRRGTGRLHRRPPAARRARQRLRGAPRAKRSGGPGEAEDPAADPRVHRPPSAGHGRAATPHGGEDERPRDQRAHGVRAQEPRRRRRVHEARRRRLPREALPPRRLPDHAAEGPGAGGPGARGAPAPRQGGEGVALSPAVRPQPPHAGHPVHHRPDRRHRHHRARARRERHRQGPPGPHRVRELLARREALRQGQLRGAPPRPPRERALRLRTGRVHRRQLHEAGEVRVRERRHRVPRRDHRDARGPAGEAAPRAPGRRGVPRGRQGTRPHRRAGHRRDQPQHRGGDPRQAVPERSLLPAQRRQHPDSSAAGAADEVTHLVDYFLERYSEQYNRPGARCPTISWRRWPHTTGRETCASSRTT